MNVRVLVLWPAALVACLISPVAAGPSLDTQVSSNAEKACDFAPLPAVVLGAYDWHAGIATTIDGELAVTCNLGVVYSITSDRGLAAGGAQNYLTFGSQKLAYSLLVGGASGTFDPAASGQPQTEIASGKLDAFSLVVNVPAAQMVPVGPYTDTVTFSLNY